MRLGISDEQTKGSFMDAKASICSNAFFNTLYDRCS